MEKKASWLKAILIQLGMLAASSVFFAASFPNIFFKNGLPFLAYFTLIPILILIRKNSLLPCVGWGAIYGFTSYSLFNYWLATFHPLAGTVVYSVYLVYMALVFLFLKLADILFPKKAYLVQWLIWLAYEYLKTVGFLGYPYGISGYTQWQIIPLIQIASITGVWGVCALVTFPSFWIAGAFSDKIFTTEHSERQKYKDSTTEITELHERIFNHEGHGVTRSFNKISIFFSVLLCALRGKILIYWKSSSFHWLKKEKIPLIIWAAAMSASIIFGVASLKDFSESPQANIALIQHNTDPWEAAKAPTSWLIHEAYRRDLVNLMRLSDQALASEPKPDLVVWPETAFVPRIYWHATYRDDQNSWLLVRELLEYLSVQDVPFLIGNDDARKDPAKNPNVREDHRIDYNAALLFEYGQVTAAYRKLHLVPFTEHFPYQKQLPFVYKALEKADTHFWEKGEEETVFKTASFSFSAPICFEDTFGYLSRNFVLRGADVLVNMTNDAWAKSLSSQNQHLAMAVFRAVENHRPMVRSTVSGQTCAIDPLGRITAEAAPFTETWLNVSVPIVEGTAFYTLYGDYLAFAFCISAITLLLFGVIWCTIKKRKRG